MGTPSFAVVPLSRLLEEKFEIAAVVTAPDKPSGRGLSLNSSEVKKFAIANNLPVLQPVSLRDPVFLGELSLYQADLFIVVAFRMLPEVVWSMPPLGTFNLHASLLPRYRGAAPINWAIIRGEKVTGVTTFMLDKEIDTGDILFRQECPIDDNDDFGTLHDKLAEIGASLVVKSAEAITQGLVKTVGQSVLESKIGNIPSAPKLTKESGKIDWKESGESVRNLVRGLSPYPGAHSRLTDRVQSADINRDIKGEQSVDVKIFRCIVTDKKSTVNPGTILVDAGKRLFVACRDYYLEITELQMSGKRRMTAEELLRGFRNIEKFKFV